MPGSCEERTIADSQDEAEGDYRGGFPQQRMHPPLTCRPVQQSQDNHSDNSHLHGL